LRGKDYATQIITVDKGISPDGFFWGYDCAREEQVCSIGLLEERLFFPKNDFFQGNTFLESIESNVGDATWDYDTL
jgi:hypothetical protein